MKNVIILSIDALRPDRLSCYGYDLKTTPFLEKLVKKGVLFRNCISNGGHTASSFLNILTSTLKFDFDDEKKVSNDRVFISEILQKKGYKTGAFHSSPYISSVYGYNKGFDTFDDSLLEDTTKLRTKLLNQIKKDKKMVALGTRLFKGKEFKRKAYMFMKGEDLPYVRGAKLNSRIFNWINKAKGGPFFLWVHYMDAHSPYYPDLDCFKTLFQEGNLVGLKKFNERRDRFAKGLEKKYSKEDLELLSKIYDADILYIDHCIQNLMNYLRREGLLSNTMIIITSDHGEELMEHGSIGHGMTLYEENIQVPLIIYSKDLKGGKAVDKVVSSVDIPPTILSYLGLPKESSYRGRNLFGKYSTKPVVSQFKTKRLGSVRSIRSDNFKLIVYDNQNKKELYDLKKDPQEKNNIILENKKIASYLEKELSKIESRKPTSKKESLLEEIDL